MPHKGYKYSKERNQQLSKSLEGRKLSNETKQKMHEAHLGKKRSEETKQKISNAHLGKKHSEATKQKMRESWTPNETRGYSKQGYHNGIFYDSSYELKFMQLLDEYHIPYERADNKNFRVKYIFKNNEHYYYPDFYLPRENSIVELKPHFRLNEPGTKAKLNAARKQYGEKFIVITEQELLG